MLKVMQLKASFATSIFRRFFFWSIGVYVVAIVVACVLTASPSGGIATIAGSLKYLVALTTILQIVTISFLLRWNMYVDSVTPSPWIHATLTGSPIGATVYYVIVERFSIARGDDIRETFCTISSLIICSIFTVFAYLVDNERKGSFKILLPDISPIISQNLQKLISSDLRHWFKTAVFIGIFLVCAENILSLLGTSFHLALDPNYSCKIDDNRTRCTSDQVGNYSTLSSVYFATIVSFMIRFVLEIAHTLLMQMLTFPLDFSKLAAQNIPNSLSKRASVGEDLISDALAIAGAQLNSERFSWHRNYLKGTGGSNGAALMHSLIGDRRVNELCQSHLLKSSSLGRGAVPVWQEPVEKQRLFAENLLAAVQPSLYCSPILPFFSSNTGVSRLDIICRSLALQDLKRSTLASNTRKKSVFEFSGKWPEIVFSCCAILDATSLQLQIFVAHAVCEILEPQLASKASQALHSSVLTSRASHQSLGQRPDGSPLGLQSTGDSVAPEWNGSITWTVTEIIKTGKDLREKTIWGKVSKVVKGSNFFSKNIPQSAVKAMMGVKEMDFDPIPPLLVQTVVHAVECVSVLLVSALSLDPTGTAQHHLISVLYSLLALELALKGHSDTLNRCLSNSSSGRNPKGIATAALLNSFSRVHHTYMSPLGLTRRGTLLSAGLATIEIAVDDAITRLIKGYKDILVTFVFPPLYANSMRVKIAAQN